MELTPIQSRSLLIKIIDNLFILLASLILGTYVFAVIGLYLVLSLVGIIVLPELGIACLLGSLLLYAWFTATQQASLTRWNEFFIYAFVIVNLAGFYFFYVSHRPQPTPPPPPLIHPVVSLVTNPSIATSVAPDTAQVPIMVFEINNPSSSTINYIGAGLYFGGKITGVDFDEVYLYDASGMLIGTSTPSENVLCTYNCPRVSGAYGGTYSIPLIDLTLAPYASTTLTFKTDILKSAVAGDIIAPTILDGTLQMYTPGQGILPSGLPLAGSSITIL